jgi:glutamate 5-kinase
LFWTQVPVRGSVSLDVGAVAAVKDKKKSLFAAGITKARLHFTLNLVLCIKCGAGG